MSQKKQHKKNEKDLERVSGQYEDYPYPMRDPLDEKKRILKIEGEHLKEMNHWLFQGKENFESGFRVLIAGGGTGDSVIFLAEQLKNTNAEIIYLDFSAASMAIAKQRAKIRGLRNIKWIHDSILNIPNLGLGKFDYINCSGVLHHLPSPTEGLKILQESLTPRGGMGIMVYGTYGRTGYIMCKSLCRW
jgi:ubiquinone/menaquinone biosynthesis C-methylase UbiE